MREYHLSFVMIHAVTQRCAAQGTFGGLLDAGMNAPITAHIGQTSLEKDAPKSTPEVLVEDGVNGRIEGGIHIA